MFQFKCIQHLWCFFTVENWKLHTNKYFETAHNGKKAKKIETTNTGFWFISFSIFLLFFCIFVFLLTKSPRTTVVPAMLYVVYSLFVSSYRSEELFYNCYFFFSDVLPDLSRESSTLTLFVSNIPMFWITVAMQ